MFRFLRRVAVDHAAADRLGVPVLEFREARLAREAGTFSRRTVLKIGGAVGGAALLLGVPRRAAAAPVVKGDKPRVAIVGAGIAGLNAALTLADAGIPSTVYEATDGVGGRMYSERAYWDAHQVSEYGGERIDTGHTVIRDLCARFGIGLTDVRAAAPKGSHDVLFFDGAFHSHKQFVQDFGPVYKALQDDIAKAPDFPTWDASTPASTALSNMSVQEWIATRVPGGYHTWLARFIDDAYVIEYGRETWDQTAVNLVYLLAEQGDLNNPEIWGGSDETFHITGGNQRLPEAIAGHLPDGTVRHGWRLDAIVRNADGTQTLTFNGHKQITADRTILTVPLGVLKRIDYRRAGFDPRMKAAIANLTMGFNTKLNMQFTDRPWLGRGPWPGTSTGSSFSDTGYQQIWDATAGQAGTAGIAIQYGGGERAQEFQPGKPFATSSDPYVRAAVHRKLRQYEAVLPGITRHWTGKATLSAWHLNPYSHGAYSCFPVAYCHLYAGYEGQHQGNIHIAGEHTSLDFQGFMNGGAESGARAASEVLAALR
ncbi:monoamine oxidase [Actinocrispum wychmicini]|uniref:Monoamine oxidase n=2 Tax=Actinocrispum wychmicini TaxID=1213861 RepID=A0A4R2J8P2_9PSEU|nr:monoamine oxidase [Actinocrispum wychmicini]